MESNVRKIGGKNVSGNFLRIPVGRQGPQTTSVSESSLVVLFDAMGPRDGVNVSAGDIQLDSV